MVSHTYNTKSNDACQVSFSSVTPLTLLGDESILSSIDLIFREKMCSGSSSLFYVTRSVVEQQEKVQNRLKCDLGGLPGG